MSDAARTLLLSYLTRAALARVVAAGLHAQAAAATGLLETARLNRIDGSVRERAKAARARVAVEAASLRNSIAVADKIRLARMRAEDKAKKAQQYNEQRRSAEAAARSAAAVAIAGDVAARRVANAHAAAHRNRA